MRLVIAGGCFRDPVMLPMARMSPVTGMSSGSESSMRLNPISYKVAAEKLYSVPNKVDKKDLLENLVLDTFLFVHCLENSIGQKLIYTSNLDNQ